MRFLALVLFLPTFGIFSWLYWSFPRALPRTAARRRFDIGVLCGAIALTVLALSLAFGGDYGKVGPIWSQVAATLAAYHVFPVVLALAWMVRKRLFG